LWEQNSRQILLTDTTAESLIRSFGKLNVPTTAMQVYRKLKRDWTFKSSDSTSLFEAALGCSSSFDDIFEILNDMKKYKINITLQIYLVILRQCSKHGDIKSALVVMKEYVDECYGLPLYRGIVIEFFSIIARYDFGRYKREARAWLNRIVLSTKQDDVREIGLPLQDQEDTTISPMQSMLISKYIRQIEYSRIVAPVEHRQPFESLFTGTEIDVEDILIYEYGYDEKLVHEAMGVDPNYIKAKAHYDKIEATENKTHDYTFLEHPKDEL